MPSTSPPTSEPPPAAIGDASASLVAVGPLAYDPNAGPWTDPATGTTHDGLWFNLDTGKVQTSLTTPPIDPTELAAQFPNGIPLTPHGSPLLHGASIFTNADTGEAPLHTATGDLTFDPTTGALLSGDTLIGWTNATDIATAPHGPTYIEGLGWYDTTGNPLADLDTRYLDLTDLQPEQLNAIASHFDIRDPDTGELLTTLPDGTPLTALHYDPLTNTLHTHDPTNWILLTDPSIRTHDLDHAWLNTTTGDLTTHPTDTQPITTLTTTEIDTILTDLGHPPLHTHSHPRLDNDTTTPPDPISNPAASLVAG